MEANYLLHKGCSYSSCYEGVFEAQRLRKFGESVSHDKYDIHPLVF